MSVLSLVWGAYGNLEVTSTLVVPDAVSLTALSGCSVQFLHRNTVILAVMAEEYRDKALSIFQAPNLQPLTLPYREPSSIFNANPQI